MQTQSHPLALPQIKGAVASPSWKASQKERLQHAWEIAKANPGISIASLQHLAGVSKSSAWRVLRASKLLAHTRAKAPVDEWTRKYRPSTPVTIYDDWDVVWQQLKDRISPE